MKQARPEGRSHATKQPEMDLVDAYELLADDAQGTNVEIFLEAQTESAEEP